MLSRDAEMMGLEPPSIVKNVPTLDEALQFYIDAFWELGSERQIGFGVGPIPVTSILEYGKYFKLDEYEMYDFKYLIRAMDVEFLKLQSVK